MDVKIYIEGGGNSKEEKARCREGFRKLIEKAGFTDRMPRAVACGGRNETFSDFQTGLQNKNQVSLLLVDSEDIVTGLTATVDHDFAWQHLQTRDNWTRPLGTTNNQALLMATCMESWICADRQTIREHYGTKDLQENALPSLIDLENRDRHNIQDALAHATRKSTKAYRKGTRSFELLAKLNTETLETNLSQFKRLKEILKEVLL